MTRSSAGVSSTATSKGPDPLLQYQRDSLVRKVAGLGDAAGRRSPVDSGTCLLWLIKHMASAEITWMLRRFAGRRRPGTPATPTFSAS
jgi:hypothetical protein